MLVLSCDLDGTSLLPVVARLMTEIEPTILALSHDSCKMGHMTRHPPPFFFLSGGAVVIKCSP